MDIIDVWFESGSSQASVCPHLRTLEAADMYLEGGDQYRGWFHSSFSVPSDSTASLPTSRRHQWMDPRREWPRHVQVARQHVDPVDIAKRMGGEIVRFWVASVDFREECAPVKTSWPASPRIPQIRNTFRYILGNSTASRPPPILFPSI